MPPALCNKCHSGAQCDGDSWCLGCSAVESSLRFLRRRWNNPGLRRVAEESLISAARLLKAFSNVDSNLVTSAAVDPHPLTAAKSRAERPRSRSPKRDERPPLVRQSPKAKRERSPKEADYGGETSYEEETEEEEEVAPDPSVLLPPPPPPRPVEEGAPSGSRPPPEPKRPPKNREVKEEREAEHHSRRESHPHRDEEDRNKKKKKKKHKKRGGTRHQRHWRETTDPFRASHRRLDPEYLNLSRSPREGLERRA